LESLWRRANIAVRDGSWSKVRRFLEQEPSLAKVQDKDSLDALQHVAARLGEREGVELCIGAGAELNIVNAFGESALGVALRNRHWGVARLLQEHGVSVDTYNSEGNSPLHHAALGAPPALLKWILAKTPTPDRRNLDDMSALHLAIWYSCEESIALLRKTCDTIDIFLAAAFGEDATIKEILVGNSGLLEEWLGPEADTPLGWAAFRGQYVTARLLLDLGADVGTDHSVIGATPLTRAASRNHMDVVKLLLYAGAWVNAADYDYKTALHWAAERGNSGMLHMLLQHGADIDAISGELGTPLHHAVASGKIAVVRSLVSLGADATLKNDEGVSAHELAVECGRSECAKALAAT